MKRILIMCPSNKGTIASCTLNIYEGLKNIENVEVRCLLLYKVSDGLVGFDECPFVVDRTRDISNNISYIKKIKIIHEYKKMFNPETTISTLIVTNTLNVLTSIGEKKIGIFHAPFKQAWAYGLKNVLLQFFSYLFLYSRFFRLYCVSEEVKKSVARFPTIKNDKINVVYNIHNIEKIQKLSEESLDEDRSFFIAPTLLYCGRLDKNKAPMRAIKGFSKSSFSKCGSFVIIGSDTDKMKDEIESYIKENQLENKIFYLGPKKNPYKYMRSSIALISSSYSEGLPGVLIEALSLNKPIASTNSSEGVWEIMEVDCEYKQNLSGIYETPVGYISSNNSVIDKDKEDEDIDNLAKAIDMTVDKCFSVKSNFIEKVKDKYILSYFLDL